MITDEKLDNLLIEKQTDYKGKFTEGLYIRQYFEQYRLYLRVMGNTVERRQRSNEFFLGINTAIMAVLGYIEANGESTHSTLIFSFVPFIGIVICRSWWQAMQSYRQLMKAKFRVVHRLEQKMPVALFEAEWEVLGKAQEKKLYYPLSLVEKDIPIIFILLYLIIFLANSPFMSLFPFH